jgi:hypothetical protein
VIFDSCLSQSNCGVFQRSPCLVACFFVYTAWCLLLTCLPCLLLQSSLLATGCQPPAP